MKRALVPLVLLATLLGISCNLVPQSDNLPPSIPIPISPVDGTLGAPLRPVLAWTPSLDPDREPVYYVLYCDINTPPEAVLGLSYKQRTLADWRTIEYTPDFDLSPLTRYYWRVKAYDGNGGEAFSTVLSFTTKAEAPGGSPTKPGLSEPDNGSTNVSLTPTFVWEASTDPDGDSVVYDVYLGNSSPPSTKINALDVTATQFIRTTSLAPNSEYYWQVTAKDASGNSTQSDIWSFTSESAPTPPPTTGLVAYYPFNGNANDESGNANHGTVNGAVLVDDRFGNAAGAYSFDGVDDFIDVPDTPELNPTAAISVAAWFRLRSFSTSYPPIVKKSGDGSIQGYGWTLECHYNPRNSSGTLIGPAVFFNATLVTEWGYSDPAPISLNTWYFVVGVYNGVSFKLYMNGQLHNSMPFDGEITISPNHLNIGRDPSNLGRTADAVIDDVRIYNRALSDAEVQTLFQDQ